MYAVIASVQHYVLAYVVCILFSVSCLIDVAGSWNDPCLLLGEDMNGNPDVTPEQSRFQFTAWAVLAAPLLLSQNVRNLSSYRLETYTKYVYLLKYPLALSARIEVCIHSMFFVNAVLKLSASVKMHWAGKVASWRAVLCRLHLEVLANILLDDIKAACQILVKCCHALNFVVCVALNGPTQTQMRL